MCQRETKADRSAVVEDVDGETRKTDRIGESAGHLGEIGEAIGELRPVGRHSEAEARQVRRHDVIAVGKQGNEIAEHMRRGREAVQQQEGRMTRIAGFSIEDGRRSGFYGAIAYFGGGLGHCRSPLGLALVPDP